MDTELRQDIDRLRHYTVRFALGGLGLSLLGMLFDAEQFFRSYLFAYVFWIGLALGSLAIVMLHHLTGGAWGFVTRRVLEAGTRTLPVMAFLFVPMLFGLSDLYSWARPEMVAADALLQHKRLYLNAPFFVIRTVVYFAVWIWLARRLNRWSQMQDETADPSLAPQLETLSGPGLVLFGGTATFASIDWLMSLDPHWFSTIYGVLFMVSQVLGTLAFTIVAMMLLARYQPFSAVLTPRHFHDLGNLLLAFVILWAYVTLSQYLIIWSGNLAEEIPWYLHRQDDGWQGIGLFLIFFHFAIPFVVLLSRQTKRERRALSVVALLLIVAHAFDLLWLIGPAPHHAESALRFFPTILGLHLMDLLAFSGVGGIWLTVFLGNLQHYPLLPLSDPSYATPNQADPVKT